MEVDDFEILVTDITFYHPHVRKLVFKWLLKNLKKTNKIVTGGERVNHIK